jgi:carbamoyltransferase
MKFHLGLEPEPFDCYVNGVAESPETMRSTLAASGLRPAQLDVDRVASRLAEGAIVAVAIGASEIGPRALGNRSLLAHSRIAGMKKRLSEGVKQREWYRPLGAAIRLERFREVFGEEAPSPYMLYSYACPPGLIPEATHADGTSRLQTVAPHEHPFLHRLLGAFEERSGCPALINTSLNRRERAIAYRTRDVLDDFLDADVDLFVFGDLMAERP